MASFYSSKMHGRRMSDGTAYHRDSFTCAHRSHPLGTMLKVTNLKNSRSVVVKVTDRCRGRRIIDLSYAAAKAIDMVASGVAMVKVEKFDVPSGVPFLPEDNGGLPELDFEITETDGKVTPIWMDVDGKGKPTRGIKHGIGGSRGVNGEGYGR